MQRHEIPVRKSATYYTLGKPGPDTRRFWIVCHGYGQLADAFLANFRMLDTGSDVVVAPEGLNHFYKKGFAGEVGATWMTRLHRLSEIEDNAIYLQAIYDLFLPQLPPDVHIILLGFSQGTATVCRWAMRCRPHFHDLVLWAGLPPEDIDYAAERAYFSSKNLYLLYGSEDPFLTPDRLAMVQEIEAKNDIDFQEKTFEGGHEMLEHVLRELLEKMMGEAR